MDNTHLPEYDRLMDDLMGERATGTNAYRGKVHMGRKVRRGYGENMKGERMALEHYTPICGGNRNPANGPTGNRQQLVTSQGGPVTCKAGLRLLTEGK